jgi:type II secretory pathway component PulK
MKLQDRTRRRPCERPGVVLIAVLVVVAVLMLVGYQFHRWMRAEADAVHAANGLAQGRHLAESGLHYAAFVLAHPHLAGLSDGDGSILVSPAAIYDNPQLFGQRPVASPHPHSSGSFSILAPRDLDDPLAGSHGLRHGVEDESGKINVNALRQLDPQTARAMLLKLPGMTVEAADAVLNWVRRRDENSDSAFGDALYYASLGYTLKNGPLETAEEMLLVRGLTPRLFLGNDHNRNGVLDPEEDDMNGILDPGLGRYLTLYSREQNLDSQGRPRIWINDPDLKGLHAKLVEAVGEELANYIIGYRLQNSLSNTAYAIYALTALKQAEVDVKLAEVDVSRSIGAGDVEQEVLVRSLHRQAIEYLAIHVKVDGSEQKKPRRIVFGSPTLEDLDFSGGSQQTFGSVLDLVGAEFNMTRPGEQEETTYRSPLQADKMDLLRERLPPLLDRLSTTREPELPPRINLNTASREVLRTVPGLSEADVQVILDQRPGPDMDPAAASRFRTPAWLITEAGFSPDTVRGLESYVTTRAQVFRMQIVGQTVNGPASRIEAVVDNSAGRPRILFWRDLTELGGLREMSGPSQR